MTYALNLMPDLTWPQVVVVVTVFLCFIGLPILVSGMRDPNAERALRRAAASNSAVLDEVRAMRSELAQLRTEVAELDRVLKTVE